MLKKTITYTDYNGNQRTDDLYFNLSKAELTKLELKSEDGGFEKYINRLIAEKDNKKIVEIFEEILKLSYGVKSFDGKRFIKNEEVWNEFYESEAYSELFVELVTDAKAMAAFINAVIPQDVAQATASKIAGLETGAQAVAPAT